MSADPLVLAIDHGTSGIKAALVTVHGRVLNTSFRPTPVRFLPGGGAEQDPEDWWNALVAAARGLTDRPEAERIEAVAVSSTFSSTLAVDADGRALAPCLTWMDGRGAPYVRRLMSGFPSVMGYGLGKVARWVPRTGGGPSLSGKDDIGHVQYWKHEEPEVFDKAACFLPSKDYLNARLTGRVAASFDSVTLFWVTDTRDPWDIKYDESLLEAAGIPGEKMPPMMGSTELLGPILPTVAAELGVPESAQVVASSPDHQCAAVGAGAVLDHQAHLYVGTSSWIQCPSPVKKTDVLHSIATLPTSMPGRYTVANEQDMAGGCLAFLCRLLHPDARTDAELDAAYADMERRAGASAPGAGGLVFAPWLNGERTPVDDPHLRGLLANLSADTSTGDLVRGVYEGVACNTRWAMEHVERFVNRRLEPITIIGGGARSAAWCQVFADVLDRPLRRPVQPQQANARGAAFLAAIGLGHITFADIPALMEYDAEFEPNPTNRALYDRQYQAFRRLHKANRPFFRWWNGGTS